MSFVNDLENQFNEDILDEFLDQRVYDYSPKEDFDFDNQYQPDQLSQIHETPTNQDSINEDLSQNQYSYNLYNLDEVSPNSSLVKEMDYFPGQTIDQGLNLHMDQTIDLSFNHSNNNSSTNLSNNMNFMNNNSGHNTLNNSAATSRSVSVNINGDKRMNDYDLLRDEVSKLKFGKYNMNYVPDSINPSPDMLDFSSTKASQLPYKLDISNLPDYSRVETQIKINLNVSPSPQENLLHIPQDLVLKNKFCLYDSIGNLNPVILRNLLFLECFVMTSDLKKSCNICSKCIKREQKRASRRRGADESSNNNQGSPEGGMVKNNPNVWSDDNMIKKAVIFNCKEIVSFPAPTGMDLSKSIELSARLICYCRHHQETKGFKLLFVLKNHRGEIVGKQLSSPIMIMDRKKPTTSTEEQQPISPNSIDESSDLTTDERGVKRKKLSVDENLMYNGSIGSVGFSPISNSDTSSMRVTKPLRSNNLVPPSSNLPTILRIIPAQGPIRGGIEVTLLGFNFHPNLSVKFGANAALATHCWSETTIVTYLPPASIPGQVLVSFEGHDTTSQQQVFTYTDDTDKQLIELALQIVGLKMNGKLEDAKNIAKRIVGSGNSPSVSSNTNSPIKTENTNDSNINSLSMSSEPVSKGYNDDDKINDSNEYDNTNDWYTNAQGKVNQLNTTPTESTVISFLKLIDLPNCPTIPNWQLTNGQGQTLLQLATIKSYNKLVKFLINHGCSVDYRDNLGCSALFYAGVYGNRDLISLFQSYGLEDEKVKDYCDFNVLDMLSNKGLRKIESLELINVTRRTVVESDHEFDGEFEDSDMETDYFKSSDEETIHQHMNIGKEDDAQSNETITNINNEDRGLWQKVKDVFNKSDDELPNYDDLFPFGPSSRSSKPKTRIEQQLNESLTTPKIGNSSQEGEIDSDSSEDMIISYINHPRKTVENDKMLIFFWVPVLILLVCVFISVSMGHKFEVIENFKNVIRDSLGNLMVGNERIKRVFTE